MDSMNLEFLAKETMDLSLQLSNNHHSTSFGDEDQFSMEKFDLKEEFPEAPGLLYYVDRGPSTFVIRGVASENAKQDAESFERIFEGTLWPLQRIEI